MTTRRLLPLFLLAIASLAFFSSCEDGKSYADLLNQESKYVNSFLADHRVIGYVPEDSVFEHGKDAPYYQLDEEGNIYMQVIDPEKLKKE